MNTLLGFAAVGGALALYGLGKSPEAHRDDVLYSLDTLESILKPDSLSMRRATTCRKRLDLFKTLRRYVSEIDRGLLDAMDAIDIKDFRRRDRLASQVNKFETRLISDCLPRGRGK